MIKLSLKKLCLMIEPLLSVRRDVLRTRNHPFNKI